MNIRISTADGVPIYLQIINQVKQLAATGQLKPGDELPPVRSLGEQILVNPNTVARAYRELEREGLIFTRRGAGTYLSDSGSALSKSEKTRILSDRIDALLAEASNLRIGTEEVITLLNRRAKLLGDQRKEDTK